MEIIPLINTIKSLADAVPEVADLCKTLIQVAQDYDENRAKKDARKRWDEKNAAIDAAIICVQRMHNNEIKQHGQVDKTSTVQRCGNCGTRVDS